MLSKKTKLNLIVLFIAVFCGGFFYFSSIAYGDDQEINAEIKALNNEIQAQKNKIKENQEQQKAYSQAIEAKQSDKASLNNQLAILENRIAKAEIDIENTEIEISKVNLEIQKVNIEIEDKNDKIEEEKDHMVNVLKIMYKQNQVSSLEALLANDSLVDFLNELKYLEDINEEIGNSLDNLEQYKEELEEDKLSLDKKNKELLELKEELEEDMLALEEEKENKTVVLEQVKDSEQKYQSLLSQAKQEQNQASSDIASLEQAVREKMAALSSEEEIEFNDSGLIWPVPQNTITSKFHDPEYPFRYIFEHPAIDIRAAQGTTLRAAASGYVARVKIQGTSYGYIMIVHGNGLSTVYGHASRSYVQEDEYVVQGQTIGLSGGMPGTTGAGSLTTGPHLHFEVRLNGIPVNPEDYLP